MKIKELRQRYNLSQTELAKIANTSQRTISSYENSNATQNIEALIKIADYFHTSIDALVEHEIPYLLDKSILNAECQKAIDRIVKLTEHQCSLVNAYITGILNAEDDKQKTISKFKGE